MTRSETCREHSNTPWKPRATQDGYGLPIQVNTLVSEETADDLPAIYELLRTSFPVMRWSLFFLISVGRGKALNPVSPEEGERIMNWVLDLVPKRALRGQDHGGPFLPPSSLSTECGQQACAAARDQEAARFTGDFRFAMATASSLFPIWATFILPVSCRCVAAACATALWSTSIATLKYSAGFIGSERISRQMRNPANTATSAEDRAPAPSLTRAMR